VRSGFSPASRLSSVIYHLSSLSFQGPLVYAFRATFLLTNTQYVSLGSRQAGDLFGHYRISWFPLLEFPFSSYIFFYLSSVFLRSFFNINVHMGAPTWSLTLYALVIGGPPQFPPFFLHRSFAQSVPPVELGNKSAVVLFFPIVR